MKDREPKERVPLSERLARWQEEGRAAGFGPEEAAKLLGRVNRTRDTAQEMREALDIGLKRLSERAFFSERDLLREVATEAQGRGLSAQHIRLAVSHRLTAGEDIECIGERKKERQYALKATLEDERQMLDAAERLHEARRHRADREKAEGIIGLSELSGEQAAAVRHITRGSDLALVSGWAGTGKTRMLQAAGKIWAAEGRNVIGACVAGNAAKNLSDESGIRSDTVAKLLWDIQGKGRRRRYQFDEKTVLVIDEAGMVSTKALKTLIGEAHKAGSKVVMVGDENQLQAVCESGGGFKSLIERHGGATLRHIRRQRSEDDRLAVYQLATGNAEAALRSYIERGLFYEGRSRSETRRLLVEKWREHGLDPERLKETLIFAQRNADVDRLNALCQAERRQAGQLGEQGVKLDTGQAFAGDRVILRARDRDRGIENGMRGTLVRTEGTSITVRLDSGQEKTVDLETYGRAPEGTRKQDAVKLAYAVTTHAGQGQTVESSYVLLGGSMTDREMSYVQASRARGSTQVFASKTDGEIQELIRQMGRSRQKELASDLQREAQRDIRQDVPREPVTPKHEHKLRHGISL